MNMDKSIWSEFDSKKDFPTLDRNIECETLVIGGGIADGVLSQRSGKAGSTRRRQDDRRRRNEEYDCGNNRSARYAVFKTYQNARRKKGEGVSRYQPFSSRGV